MWCTWLVLRSRRCICGDGGVHGSGLARVLLTLCPSARALGSFSLLRVGAWSLRVRLMGSCCGSVRSTLTHVLAFWMVGGESRRVCAGIPGCSVYGLCGRPGPELPAGAHLWTLPHHRRSVSAASPEPALEILPSLGEVHRRAPLFRPQFPNSSKENCSGTRWKASRPLGEGAAGSTGPGKVRPTHCLCTEEGILGGGCVRLGAAWVALIRFRGKAQI